MRQQTDDMPARSPALGEVTEEIRAALAAASAGIWSLDPTTGEMQWSKEVFELMGIDPTTVLSTETALAHVHPDDVAIVIARRHEQLARGDDIDIEYRVLHPTRGVRWHETRGRRTADGRVLGITLDVTERRQSDERLRLVMDAVPALISYVGPDLRYRFNNQAYEEWFGVARNHFVGMSMRDALGEAALERLKPKLDLVLSGERTSFESELKYRFGGTRYVHVDYVPDIRADGRVDGFYVFVTDISERRKVELAQAQQVAELRASEERFRELADAAPAMLWLTDESNFLSFISRGWFDHTGQTETEAYADGIGWTRMVHPDDREVATVAFMSASEKRVPFELEYRCVGGMAAIDGLWMPAVRGSPKTARGSVTSAQSSTSTRPSRPAIHCAKPTAARMSSWRCWRTNCAIPSRPSAMRCTC